MRFVGMHNRLSFADWGEYFEDVKLYEEYDG